VVSGAGPTLEDAIALAVEAHRGQRDKAGQTYILHPLRVMMRLETETERMVAVLHDVVEDSPWTLERLRALGYPEEVLDALDCLTKREGESYEAFIERVLPHPLARRVKRADLEDNMDVRRLPAVTAKDAERLARYRAAWARLQEA
jgi:(p)ppGpp synthase/HD superfamily hydrolase